MKTVLTLGLLMLAFGFIATPTIMAEELQAAPELQFSDILGGGDIPTLESMQGQIVLLEFWSTT